MSATLLVEIGVEELPPGAMRRLADAFAHGLSVALDQSGLTHGEVSRYATPRRLAVTIAQLAGETEPAAVEKAGPTVAIAFDHEGAPTAAAKGFARSVNASVEVLEREDSVKGERLIYRATAPGKPLAELLQPAVDAALRGLPIPKRMRWGVAEHAFVRPVHWLVAMHGRSTLPLEVFGETGGTVTYGHRFHHPDAIELNDADDYVSHLYCPGRVIADIDHRKAQVVEQVRNAAARVGGIALIEDTLAEEVCALVEWPVGIAGRFDPKFLILPREVLISTLQGHQRYFPVHGNTGELLAGFVTVANIESRDEAQVVAGNERVVKPRLADALFFWEQDRRHGLYAHVAGLARVSFQSELGSMADKSERVRQICGGLSDLLGVDRQLVERAAILSKTDLLTEMVGEFPELQGIMGRYYALDAGEPTEVASALAEQYAPASAGAPIARTPVGQTLALADRLDTLAGIFSIDKRPSGDKDPFALRRSALGVLRTVIETPLDIDLARLISDAVSMQPIQPAADTCEALWMFHMERLRGYYTDRGVTGDLFEAVAAQGIVRPADFDARIKALQAFVAQPDAAVVCAAHKRIRNILRRNSETQAHRVTFDITQFTEPAEIELAAAFQQQRATIANATTTHCYHRALTALTELAAPLDAFFTQVMVMTTDEALRTNRLALLNSLDHLCRQVADLARLSLD